MAVQPSVALVAVTGATLAGFCSVEAEAVGERLCDGVPGI